MISTVSFIIPHKGREEMLWQTVESISKQTLNDIDIEIIILTQNDSLKLPEEFAQINCQIQFQNELLTISGLRNKGAEQAMGEYLAFLDADVYLSADWTETLIKLLNEKAERILVSAMQVNSITAPPLEKIRTCLSNTDLDTNVSFMPGRNLFLKKSDFFKTTGFPEHLTTCEDYYFTNELTQLGDIYYSSQAQYVHLGEDKAYWPMFKKEIWRGQSNLLSIKGRTPPLREIPSFIIPIAMLIFTLLGIFYLVQSDYFIANLYLCLTLLPIIAYSLRLISISKFTINSFNIFGFYLIYFPARAIGSTLGIFHWFKNKKLLSNA